jgi:hypothetical protein
VTRLLLDGASTEQLMRELALAENNALRRVIGI